MANGLQQAQEAFKQELSGELSDTQQLEVQEEVAEEAEPEAEEPEAEADSGIETEGENLEEAEEEPEEKYYPVKLDGIDHEVTLDEALAGYQRQQDYTKKTQAVSEEKRALQAEVEAAKTERLQYQQNLERLIQQQASQQPQEPNWDQLYEADPLEWMKQKEEFRSQKERNLELQQEHYRMQQQQQVEHQQQMRIFLQDQHQNLLDVIPEWSDQKVMAQEKSQIRNYAKSIGYSEEEVSQIFDSRAVMALRSGMIASGLSGKGAKKLKSAPSAIRAVSPGSAPEQPKKQTSIHKAKIRLAKSGKMSDAKEVFRQLL